MDDDKLKDALIKLYIFFRGSKVEININTNDSTTTTVGDIKAKLVTIISAKNNNDKNDLISPLDIKLLHRGKILSNNQEDMAHVVGSSGHHHKKPKPVKLVALGVSRTEAERAKAELEQGLQRSRPLVRDDLTAQGRQRNTQRRQQGRAVLVRAAASHNTPSSRFGRIETLPMLPQQDLARSMLTTLINDVGIRNCMSSHGWTVGCLAEMYPEGNVGKSPVCVMGLNQNKGQKILLRLRTDDLRGFRKMLSVRKVLYHELAHNVHSEHDDKFFRLMRQIERECTSMDWTQSRGNQLSNSAYSSGRHQQDYIADRPFVGGSGRLGGSLTGGNQSSEKDTETLSKRELVLRAAMQRMTEEEEEIQLNCGCGQPNHEFLDPSNIKNTRKDAVVTSEAKTILSDISGAEKEEEE